MQKAEQRTHTEIMRWLSYNKHTFPKSFLIETKVVREGYKSFPLCELSSKEIRLLKQAKHSNIIQTHSDFGGMGTNCDGSIISGGGFIFIQWVRRGNKEFYVLDIDTLLGYMDDNPTVKSLTEQKCKQLACIVGELK